MRSSLPGGGCAEAVAATIPLTLPPERERQLRERAAAEGVPAEAYVVGALAERLEQTANATGAPARLSAEDSQRFAVINQGLSEAKWDRYRGAPPAPPRGSANGGRAAIADRID